MNIKAPERLCLWTGLVMVMMTGAMARAEAPVDGQSMVAAHNAVRAQYGQNGLSWSEEMVAAAAGWARKLEANTEWCQAVIHNPERPTRTGENMHVVGVTSPEQSSPAEQIVGAWASEQQYYDLDSGSCTPGQQCNHFVQVVWGETTELGCSAAVCPDPQGTLLKVTICKYRPSLLLGQKPF